MYWYPCSFLGEAHGENIEAARRNELLAIVRGHLTAILPPKIILVTIVGYMYDEDDYRPRYSESVNRIDWERIATMIFDDVVNEDNACRNSDGHYRYRDIWTLPKLLECKNYKDVMGLIEGMLENRDVVRSSVLTPKQYRKMEEEKEFNECEKIAEEFAAANNLKLGTMEFLAAVDKAVNGTRARREQYNSDEARMEEWADHYHSGAAHAYWENRDYTNGEFSGRLDDLAQCYRYIEKKFPLLMMKYKEAKLQRRNKKRTK